MAFFEIEPTIEPGMISPQRRSAIGAQIISIGVMQEIADYLSSADPRIVFSSPANASAKGFLNFFAEREYNRARRALTDGVDPDGNAHLARFQMGLVGDTTHDRYGNRIFPVNADFVIATHYVEDRIYAEKIDSELAITTVIDESYDQFVDHYATRAKDSIALAGDDANLRELVNFAANDSEYWLEH